MGEFFPLFPEQASTYAPRVDVLYFALVGFSLFFTIAIFFFIFYFAVKYRQRSPDDLATAVPSYLGVEILWTAIPFGIAMVLLVWSVRLFVNVQRPPSDTLDIGVVGRQWMWKLQHPGGQREIDELHVPVGTPVKLTLATQDVIHSFYVPAFRVKQDAVPGRYTTVWFQASKVGVYHLFCAEYCGTDHAGMRGVVYVMEPRDYQEWLRAQKLFESPVAAGKRHFERLGCGSCHGERDSERGPSLAGLPGGAVRLAGGGTAKADDNYLRESIVHPSAKLVAGYRPLMPTYQTQVTEEDLFELIAYIKSLDPLAGRGL